MQGMLYVKFCSGIECNLDLGSCLAEAISTEVVLAVIVQCHSKLHAASAGVMAFHAASPPSAEINMTVGNPIHISVQQGFDDPSIPQAEALMTQVR